MTQNSGHPREETSLTDLLHSRLFSQVRGYSGAQEEAQTPLAKPVLLATQRRQPGRGVPLRAVASTHLPLHMRLRRTRTQQTMLDQRQLASVLCRRTHRWRLERPQRRGSLRAKRWSTAGDRMTPSAGVPQPSCKWDQPNRCSKRKVVLHGECNSSCFKGKKPLELDCPVCFIKDINGKSPPMDTLLL